MRLPPSYSIVLSLWVTILVLAQAQREGSGQKVVLSPPSSPSPSSSPADGHSLPLKGGKGEEGEGEGGRGGKGNGPLDAGFAAFAREKLDRWRVPGVAVAVVEGDDVWAEGYGIATFPSTPVTPSTLFYAGSTTKAFTAAVVSLLIASGNFSTSSSSSSSSSQGKTPLNWQTPLSHLLPSDFALQDGNGWAAAHLTLEDALSHRTGLARHDKALARRYPHHDDNGTETHPGTVRDVTRSLRHLPVATEPRVGWRYCNLMFMVVSHAVQTLTGGRWLGETMRELVWGPLGMGGTFLSVEDALEGGWEVARGYYWDYLGEVGKGGEGGKGFVPVPFSSLYLASGAGGVVTSVLDYAKWIQCLIRGDNANNDKNGCPVLPPEAHRELKAARMVLPPSSRRGYDAPLSYALGWNVGTYKGNRVFMHSGGMEAHGAEVYFFPELGFGVVVLANTAVTSNVVGWELAWKLINERIGVREGEGFDWAGLGKERVDAQLKLADTAIESLYPDRADPPLPRALPLERYVGVYSHPAYQNVTIELVDGDKEEETAQRPTDKGERVKEKGELKAIRDNMEWQMTFEFRHVSGEFWAVVIDMLNTPNMLSGQLARAEFVVGVGGTVEGLKMEFLEDGSEGVIVFERIA